MDKIAVIEDDTLLGQALVILGALCVAIPEGVFRRMRKNRGE